MFNLFGNILSSDKDNNLYNVDKQANAAPVGRVGNLTGDNTYTNL